MVAKYAGTRYPNIKNPDDLQDTVNFMRMAGEAQTLSLSANRPRFLVNSSDASQQGHADHFRRTLDTYSKRMKLQKPLQDCALDGYFGLAIAKVCRHEWSWPDNAPREYAEYGWPNVIRVGFDHFVYDTEAVDFPYCSFMGDRYRRRMSDVLNNPRFNPEAIAKVRSLGDAAYGKYDSEEWTENIASTGGVRTRHEEWVYLADIYIADEKKICTYLVDHGFKFLCEMPLAEVEWEGLATGPYCFLNFGKVPDQTKSSSPAQQILHLDDFINTLYRKLEDQARAQKNIGIVDVSEEESGEKLRNAKNGEWVPANPQAATVVGFDGPDQSLFALLMKGEGQLSKVAGNLDHKLGLGAQADTAAQESMISANVSRVDAAYSEKFVDFVREIAMKLARLIYYDAALEVRQSLTIPNSSLPPVNDDWLPTTQVERDEFDVLDVDIDPYSLAYQSPSQRSALLRQDIQTFLPAMETLGALGVQVDLAAALEELAHLENRPELRRLLKYNQPIQQNDQQSAHRRSMPMPSNRKYTHENVSRPSREGQQHSEMMEALNVARNN